MANSEDKEKNTLDKDFYSQSNPKRIPGIGITEITDYILSPGRHFDYDVCSFGCFLTYYTYSFYLHLSLPLYFFLYLYIIL